MKQQPTDEIPPSPLDAFVATVTMMANNRRMICGAVESVSNYEQMLEDLEMMTREGVIHGLRSRWCRRVAIPVFQARRALQKDGDLKDKGWVAVEILEQCDDEYVKTTCINWIRKVFK